MDGMVDLRQSIDYEIQAFIGSLVSALGGRGADEDGRYVLGDDALACLKDLRRWLRLYDEKTNRLDVARCLAEANLVNGDLLHILALWREDPSDDRLLSKIALASLELLVPLTWPFEGYGPQMTVNHHRHLPYLTEAQLSYKRGILNFEDAKILRTIIRIGLPSMALPLRERSNRDNGIIKLILYFMRNLAIISPPPGLQTFEDDHEVSRSATIEAFHYQDVFQLVLPIASSVGDDFDAEDVVVLDLLFHLLRGVDPEKLFMTEKQMESAKADELRSLLSKEAGMVRSYARYAPTRHNRFGTMIWIKRADERVSTVSGQDILMDDRRGLAKMDETKRWKKQKGHRKGAESLQNEVDVPVQLTASAAKHLKAFVGEFLDSAFNPFFLHVHKAIEREADRVLRAHHTQFFFLISWFLKAERARRKAASASGQRHEQRDSQKSPFALIASVLTQPTFITLNRFMQKSHDMHDWQELKAGMRCFTQILLTVQDMSESHIEEDQGIADNILSRIFYEETTHERIVAIVRYYSNQGFGYLDACTELAHVHLRLLEHYSRQNIEMQVRSRRKARRKKGSQAKEAEKAPGTDRDEMIQDGSEAEEVAEAQRTSRERKFDFNRFAARFMTQACIDTFVALVRYYKELTPEQLKRAHRFFYRVAFKHGMSVMLFRIDIIVLLNKMVKGPEGLDPLSPEGKEWSELVRQLFKKLTRMVEKRPELIVELLFSKINSTVYFLEHGYEKPVPSSKPRVPAELEVKPGLDLDRQIGVVVTVLREQNQSEAIDWIKKVLSSAIDERHSWEAEIALRHPQGQEANAVDDGNEVSRPEVPSIAVKPDTAERREATFKNNKLRLLMTLVNFQRLGLEDDMNASWIIPSSVKSEQLSEALESINRYEVNRPGLEDGRTAEDYIRRKSTARPRLDQDDSLDHDETSEGDDDFQFPAGGPTVRKSDALEELKSKRRKRKDAGEALSDTEREARRKARQENNARMQRKIKSDLFVHDSDDEDDEERDKEFFAKEEERRRTQGRKVVEALIHDGDLDSEDDLNGSNSTVKRGAKTKKRGSIGRAAATQRQKRQKTVHDALEANDGLPNPASDTSSARTHLTEEEQEDSSETPLSSPHPQRSIEIGLPQGSTSPVDPFIDAARSRPQSSHVPAGKQSNEDDGDGDDQPAAVRRPRMRAGFVIDSDSE